VHTLQTATNASTPEAILAKWKSLEDENFKLRREMQTLRAQLRATSAFSQLIDNSTAAANGIFNVERAQSGFGSNLVSLSVHDSQQM
jgi:hypothetical protein